MALAESPSVTSHRGLVAFVEREANCTVVWLQGEHDVSTVAALSEHMARAIALDDADLVVDLSGVEFMDAATVGVLIRARDFLRQRSRSLALRSPSTCAQRILDVCELSDHLDRHPVARTRTRGATGAMARRGDAALLSLIRLDERKQAHRKPLAMRTAAARLVSRPSRSTRFSRPT